MSNLGFFPTKLLMPTQNDLTRWSVIACDQYTSDPAYWERVEKFVGDTPSTLRLIYPEVWLDQSDRLQKIQQIHTQMHHYLEDNRFCTLPEGFIYLERTLRSGKIRRGLLGCVDLKRYSYASDSNSSLRPTEGTVESRLPPRIQIRQGAPLELPHIMVLVDDPRKTLLEPLVDWKPWMRPLYDFSLMEGGGHLKGWALDHRSSNWVEDAMQMLSIQLYDQAEHPLCLAVGDGNHSLATAKACFEQLKKELPRAQWENHPARFALVELCNLHDDGLTFEPIHRVVYTQKSEELMKELTTQFPFKESSTEFQIFSKGDTKICSYPGSVPQLIEKLQAFLDHWISENEGKIDYIHGQQALKALCDRPNCLGILLPGMQKQELFPQVLKNGPLPRKTFSLGEAWDKRYYLEARAL